MTIRFILILLSFSLLACQESEEVPGFVGSGITGFWKGIIKNVSSTQENVTDITLSLNSDQTFKLTKLKSRTEALGTYDEFPQLKSLTLRVDNSEVEEFALAGGIRDFEYQLFDGELLLNSLERIVRLKRPDVDSEESMNRVWDCRQDDFAWQLSIVGDQFLLYLESQSGASVFMKGSFSLEETDEEVVGEQRVVFFVEDGQPVKTFCELTGKVFYEEGYIT